MPRRRPGRHTGDGSKVSARVGSVNLPFLCVRLPLRGSCRPIPTQREVYPTRLCLIWHRSLGISRTISREPLAPQTRRTVVDEETSARNSAGQSWLYTRLACRYTGYLRIIVYTSSHMVAGVVPSTRLDSALVASPVIIPKKTVAWPLSSAGRRVDHLRCTQTMMARGT